MSDIVDRANEHAAMLLRQALEDQRRRAGFDKYANGALAGDWRVISAADCEGPHCGEPIPDDRRRAVPGVRLCTACQERIERGYRA